MFFITVKSIRTAIREELGLKGSGKEEIDRLKVEIEDLKLKKRMEEAEIKHLVKMKEEKQLIDYEKKEIELQKEFQKKEMDLQTKYHDKVLRTIEESRKESRELYTAIMERLPNVNVAMKR